ncbi:MAG TPA: hypothetical protein V6D34_03430 [Candidatus Sericytochromatia bacterium]
MSVLFKTDLAEYARQCTLQRRRYEECVQNAQQSGMNESIATSACSIDQASNLDGYPERTMQGSVVDFLGLSVEPLWEDKQTVLDDAGNGQPEEQPWHGDRSHSIQQQTTSATRKGGSSVSYSAP